MLKVTKAGLFASAFLVLVWVINLPMSALAQPEQTYSLAHPTQAVPPPASYPKSLFESEEVLRFTLLADYKELLKDRGDERSYHKATVQYQTATGQTSTIDLKVRVRGRHRRDPSVCRFPPLLLNFPKKAVTNTAFAGADKLKLVTHCISEKYVIREYLAYKLYNIVSHLSLRVRLCYINYQDLQGNKKIGGHYAFLIEDEDDLAKLNKGVVMSDELLIRMDATDDQTMAKLALFQYMIGNTDWSVPYRHNIKLLYLETYLKPVPVPYDFDYTGIVMPPYAKPPPEIGISSVRQRIFRGYSYPQDVIEGLVPFFNNRKDAFSQVYTNCHLLDDKYRKQTLKYLEDFYETINDRKDFERQIVRVGQQNEEKIITIKGLE